MNVKIDKMRFQENKISSTTAFLAIGFDAYYLLSVINNTEVTPTVIIALKILLNIAFILVVFLAMSKVKVYQKNWSYVLIVFGGLTLLRMLWMPAQLISNTDLSIVYRIHLFVILGIIASLLFISGFVSLKKCNQLSAYEKQLHSEVQHG